MGKLSLAGEVWAFLRQNKKLWLLPIVVVLLVLGALLIFAQSSALEAGSGPPLCVTSKVATAGRSPPLNER